MPGNRLQEKGIAAWVSNYMGFRAVLKDAHRLLFLFCFEDRPPPTAVGHPASVVVCLMCPSHFPLFLGLTGLPDGVCSGGGFGHVLLRVD
mmetsp:Transcript_47046/g.77305  ORF Transcript_47046/g.77305 Transcript_47046/m.77305 type:complete len:90 (+) Transcript_47046:732-1001(+)